jgi:hypothetical protein
MAECPKTTEARGLADQWDCETSPRVDKPSPHPMISRGTEVGVERTLKAMAIPFVRIA